MYQGSSCPTFSKMLTTFGTTATMSTLTIELPDSLKQSEVDLTHVDLNDNTLEGLRHRSLPLFSVQYHPEASPGPHDSHYLFREFRKMMEESKR